jgi:hypothetical protein
MPAVQLYILHSFSIKTTLVQSATMHTTFITTIIAASMAVVAARPLNAVDTKAVDKRVSPCHTRYFDSHQNKAS